MKKGVICCVLLTVIITGCSTTNKLRVTEVKQGTATSLTEVDAISKAKEQAWIKQFPDMPGKVEGVIYGGGPSPGIKVSGEFETKVKKEGDSSFIVTFTENWNGNFSSQSGPERSHSFEYRVTSSDVVLIGDSGDFPPQLIK